MLQDHLPTIDHKQLEKIQLATQQLIKLPQVAYAMVVTPWNGTHLALCTAGLSTKLTEPLVVTLDAEFRIETTSPLYKNIKEEHPNTYPTATTLVFEQKNLGTLLVGCYTEAHEREKVDFQGFAELIAMELAEYHFSENGEGSTINSDTFFKLSSISRDIFLELKPDGTIVFTNRSFQRNLGHPRDTVIGNNILNFICKEDLEGSSMNLKEVLQGRKYLNDWRGRFETKSKKKIWYNFTGITYNNRWFAIARDIDDLIYFDHQLIKERERFKFFTESSFEGLAIEIDGKIVDCNRRYLEIFEAELGDIINKPSDKYVEVTDTEFWKELTSNNYPTTYEIQGKTKSGTSIELEISRKPAFHKGQHGKLVAIRDITVRKELEKELRDRDELHQSIVRNDKILFGIVSKGVVEELSSGMLKLLGLTPTEAMGKPLHEVLGTTVAAVSDPENLLKPIDGTSYKSFTLRDGVSTFKSEIHLKNSAGDILYLKFDLRPLSGVSHDHQIIVFTDVTSLKSNLTKLQLAKDELRNTIKSARLASWHYDFDQWKLKLSPESLNILQLDKLSYDFEEFIDKIHPEDKEATMQEFNKALQGQAFSVDTRIVLNKQPRYIHIQGFAAKKNVGPGYKPIIQGIIQDISDRKRQELELQQAKQVAEQHTRAKNLFLASMSHEIRTPLNSILGFSQILENKISNPSTLKLLNAIKNSGDTLLKLINDILDLSKIESAKIELHKETFSIGKLTDYQNSLFKNIATNKNISFEIETSLHEAQVYFGDFYRINQVIMNLINNAVKFTDAGSVSLKIQEKNIDNQCFLAFDVVDTGIGIDKEAQDLIFKTFEQANPEITQRFGGTGLGLAIVKGLVETMGGSLEVESEVGKGTRFSITIAVENRGKLQKEERHSSKAYAQSNLKVPLPLRVLVAEDNPTNQILMEEIFNQLNIDFEIASDGVVALEILKEQRNFQLGIFDIQMPNMDGYTTVQNIRLNPEEYPQFPIIALTADATTQEKEHALKNGFDGFLSKPFIINDLIEKINDFFATEASFVESRPIPKKVMENSDPAVGWELDMTYLNQVTQNNPAAIAKILGRCSESLPAKTQEFLTAVKNENLKEAVDSLHAIQGQISLFLSKKDQEFISECYAKWKSFNTIKDAKKVHIYTLVESLKALQVLLNEQLEQYEK